MHQATRAGNVEIAKAILPIDICSHRRCALLAELAESGFDTKKSVMILFVESIPEQDKRKANNCERESHARKAVCGKSARTV